MLTKEEVRAFYDRFGAWQDRQAFYEDVATDDLIGHAGFEGAEAVFEFGCGTGRFAENLLAHHLSNTAAYTCCDLSATMVDLTRRRLAQFGPRAHVELTDGTFHLAARDTAYDRFVSNYVLDLLSADNIARLLAEAHHALTSAGRLCLVSLTYGITPTSRFVSSAWESVHRLRPALVGGCRPIELLDFLSEREWKVEYRNVVMSFGVPSEILIAHKLI